MLSLAEVEVFGTSSTQAPTAPSVTAFSATPAAITEGNSTTLSWSIADGGSALTSVSIDNGVGDVLGSTSVAVTPATTTTYTITATNVEGSSNASATVMRVNGSANSKVSPWYSMRVVP